MESCSDVIRKFYPLDVNISTAQDLDAVLPDAIRYCLSTDEEPYALLSELFTSPSTDDSKRLAVSYGALLSEYPAELFNYQVKKGEPILRALSTSCSIDATFIDALVSWREDGEGLDVCIFAGVLDIFTERISSSSVSSSSLDSLLTVVNTVLPSDKFLAWLLTCKQAERLFMSIAGCPILQVDSSQQSADTDALHGRYKNSSDILVSALHNLLLRCLKKDRPSTCTVLLGIANKNKDRLKMHYDPSLVCSDSAAIVMLAVLLRLAQPFMAVSMRGTKEKLIDSLYYKRHDGRLDISGLNTLIDSPQDPVNQEHSLDSKEPNFISDCFYMCLHWMKMCYVRMIDEYYENIRVLGEIDRALNSPNINPLIRMKLQADKTGLQAKKTFIEDFLDDLFDLAFEFISMLMYHLLILYRDDKYSYSLLPEFYVEIINECWLFVSRSRPGRWLTLSEPHDVLLSYAVLLLRDPQCCRNIYTRAKIIEILHGWSMPGIDGHSYPLLRFFSVTYTDFLSNTQVDLPATLTPLFFRMYVDVESTGASTQFYEKFNIRFHLTSILLILYDHMSEYRIAVRDEAQRPESFLRFQNLLLNDCTYLLDESLGKLHGLHKMEQSGVRTMEDVQNTQQIERQLMSYMQLANATVTLLACLTLDTTKAFARPEIVNRLAAMLLVNLKQLVGERCRELKVRHPERFSFDPRLLLGLLVRTFVNMAGQLAFCEAVRSDSRSFDSGLLDQVSGVLERTGAVSAPMYEAFQEASKKVPALPAPSSEAEEEMDPEFLDPLMFTLMRDPVILNTSKVTVDRSTIRAHLLNDPHDPFNRMPLTEEDLIPNEALKKRIGDYLASKGGDKENTTTRK